MVNMNVQKVIKNYQEGQQIFRRSSVSCLIARIEQLERFVERSNQVSTCLSPAESGATVIRLEYPRLEKGINA
jgi:hypothetical protein